MSEQTTKTEVEHVPVVIDSSVLVGLINPVDHRHHEAVKLVMALQENKLSLVYLDCVIAESITTISRRLAEKLRQSELPSILAALNNTIPEKQINWVYPEARRFYAAILQLMQDTKGELNFHDALIALACQDHGIKMIASFDSDFDQIAWLRRLAVPNDIV